MVQAIWNGAVIAESDQTVVVEGKHYFPPDSVDQHYLRPSTAHTVCPWKGVASYCDVVVDGETNARAAWYYPSPEPAALRIAGHVAFYRGVKARRVADGAASAVNAGIGGWLRRVSAGDPHAFQAKGVREDD